MGCSAGTSSRSVAISPASGSFILHNRDATYDPDRRGGLTELQIRKQHRCRILLDNNIAWDGVAVFGRSEPSDTLPLLVWELKGRHRDILNDIDVKIARQNGGTVADIVSDLQKQTKVSVAGGTAQPFGIIDWEGSGVYLLEALQRFAGGFAIEDYQGNWSFTRWTDTPDLPVGATFDASYGVLDNFDVAERDGYIRNYVKAVGQEWVNNTRGTIAISSNIMSQQQERVFILAGPGGDSRISGWTDDSGNYAISLSASDSRVQPTRVGNVVVLDENRIQIRVRTNQFGNGTARVTAQAIGQSQRTQKTSEKRIDINLYGSQDAYGERELRLPPWFTGGFEGIHEWVTPWLRNLSQPMLLMRAIYPTSQANAAATARLVDHATPGKRARFVLNDITFDGFVLEASLRGGHRAVPMLEVVAANVQREPAPPLGVSVEFVADVAANLVVSVEDPNGQNIYGRYRTS